MASERVQLADHQPTGPGVPVGSRQKAESGRQKAEGSPRTTRFRLLTTDNGQKTTDKGRSPNRFLPTAYCLLLHAVAADQPLDALRNWRVGGKQAHENLTRGQWLADEHVGHRGRHL